MHGATGEPNLAPVQVRSYQAPPGLLSELRDDYERRPHPLKSDTFWMWVVFGTVAVVLFGIVRGVSILSALKTAVLLSALCGAICSFGYWLRQSRIKGDLECDWVKEVIGPAEASFHERYGMLTLSDGTSPIVPKSAAGSVMVENMKARDRRPEDPSPAVFVVITNARGSRLLSIRRHSDGQELYAYTSGNG
jgi:hypothetical protein